MTSNDFGLAKSDIKSGMTAQDARKLQIGRRLAKLIYLEDQTQQKAIQRLWPHLSDDSARQNAPRILQTYNVIDCLYDLLPDTIPDDAAERLWHLLNQRAIKHGDDKMLLELLDRHAKMFGKYKQEIDLTVNRGEEYTKRVERARKLLADQGYDPAKIVKDSC